MRNVSFDIAIISIGTLLLIVGLLFASVYLTSPNVIQTKVTLAEMHNFHFNGYPPETLQQSTDNIYRSITTSEIMKDQTLEVKWYSDLLLGTFIFSEEQFAYFQLILPKMQYADRVDPVAWANVNGVTYEAAGWAGRNGIISCNVNKTGDYVAVITNVMYGAAYATIQDFEVNLSSYKQPESLYLFVGCILVISGIVVSASIFRRKRANKEKN